MIDERAINKIRQKKLDSLAAKHLHVKRSQQLNGWINLIDFLALGVPISYFALRFIFKNTSYAWIVEIIWEILAGLLLTGTALKIAYRWQEQAQRHNKLLGQNITLVGQADNLLNEQSNISSEGARLFSVLADQSEVEDREILGQPLDKDKQFAYREALKEFEPGSSSTKCPQCQSSPWQFTPGRCQLCGNTPAS